MKLKEKLIDNILEDLKTLESSTMKEIHLRMRTLQRCWQFVKKAHAYHADHRSCFGLVHFFFYDQKHNKTVNIVDGKNKGDFKRIFKSDLKIASPPEMAELTSAFNVMCDKLNKVEKNEI